MKRTPLYDVHVALGARVEPFAGWEMPIQYTGIVTEHLHTRSCASIFDTCHMGEFDVRGATAEADLERLVTQRISTMRIGQCRYGYLLKEEGGVLDDVTVFRRGPDHFFLVVNAGSLDSDAAWIQAHLSDRTTFSDLSPGRAKIDVQGPASRSEMEKALGVALPGLGYFRFEDTDLGGLPCTVSRTGYTGEWGYEIYSSQNAAEHLWTMLTERSAIRPAGLGARDTLRLEVGYPLYGHELGPDATPVRTARGSFIDTTKSFIGCDAVVRELNQGVERYLVGLRLDTKRAARAGDVVMAGDGAVGMVTSGSLAPSLGIAIALAYVDTAHSTPGTNLQVAVRGRNLSALVVPMPFYAKGTARGTSPT